MLKFIKRSFLFISVLFFLAWLYANSLIFVHPQSKAWLLELKAELNKQQLSPHFYVISGKRYDWDNWLLSKFGGAAKNSRHLVGEAIDIIVLDVNQDGTANAKDVDLVYKILNRKIVKSEGGIGTYKNQKGFFNRQMIHFDCRGKKARWHR